MVGFVLNKLVGFEIGLGVGLLIPGIVSLHFTWTFATEYLDFRDNPSRADGRVVAVEDRPANESGDITTPFAIVEFAARDGASYRADSKGGSGLQVGETVTVVYDVDDPTRAKVAVPSQLFGGGIASMLFGTFPASAGLFFLLGWLGDRRPRVLTREQSERALQSSRLTTVAYIVIFAGIVGAGFWPGSVLEQLLFAFGAISLGLWVYVVDGAWRRRDPQWTLGVSVLAINFSAWVLALWLLRGTESQW